MKKNKRIEKYFRQDYIAKLEIVFLVLAGIALFIATFLWGGGPYGLGIAIACAAGFFICRSAKTQDAEFDAYLCDRLSERGVDLTEKGYIFTHDLSSENIKKGKDGKLRADRCVIAKLTFEKGKPTKLLVQRMDIVKNTFETEEYKLPTDMAVELAENTVNTKLGAFTEKRIVCELFPEGVIISLDDYYTSELIEKLCSAKK